jgi:hypothetical protein
MANGLVWQFVAGNRQQSLLVQGPAGLMTISTRLTTLGVVPLLLFGY